MKMLDVPQSGSLAGQTSSRNRYGQYRRTRANPVQPRTARQTANRESLGALSSAWRGLTDAQRAGWEALATALPRTDSLGQTVFLTGLQTFIGFNQVRASLGEDVLATAPAVAEVGAVGEFTATGDASTPLLEVVMAASVAEDTNLLIFASPPRSQGVSFENDFRLMGVLNSGDDTLEFTTVWTSKFGAPVEGQKIFVRIVPCTTDGQAGAAVQGNLVVVA